MIGRQIHHYQVTFVSDRDYLHTIPPIYKGKSDEVWVTTTRKSNAEALREARHKLNNCYGIKAKCSNPGNHFVHEI